MAILAVGAVLGVALLRPFGGGTASQSSPWPGTSASGAVTATAASASGEQNLPAYEPSTGFEPDAARILTVTSIRISLEEYRAANGAYPASLDALFPSFAPLGQNGQAMTAPPPVSDGYAYVQTGTMSYTLSVQLSNGQTYSVTAPEGP